ncbi:XdhC family protein [Bradyrhizobium sp. CCBAU 45384]|uniref:XdhC family protein n=1 Tax=Bradyrhizobium sp. CCBAU 45384 TaxID=858428 RepID=UPI002306AAD8|nr:XdhC family protein [Bradyrhizobium sp. CCBAU 45384]
MAMTRPTADFAGTDVLTVTSELMAAQRPFALGIVIEAKGSTSARVGAKAIFDGEGTVICGWVGGGRAESTIAHAAIEVLESEIPQVVDLDLDDEVLGAGMPCMRVYVEPVIPRPTLWILGHGRVAECLCHLGALLSFDVVVDDPAASPDRYPDAKDLIIDDPSYVALRPTANDFVVIATQHRGDHDSLRRLLASDAGYIGLIASRKRTALVIDYLRAAGFDRPSLDRIRAPAGINIDARTAEEIALSVVGEVVLFRRSYAAKRGLGSATPNAFPLSTGESRRPALLSVASQHELRVVGE